jgi:hypothetical protein
MTARNRTGRNRARIGIRIERMMIKRLYKNSVARMQAVRPKSGGFLALQG